MEKALKKHAPIFVLPTFLAFVIGFIIPFAQGFYLSFCKFTTVGKCNICWNIKLYRSNQGYIIYKFI